MEAPFTIGQRVVALKTSKVTFGQQLVKGNIYTIEGCIYMGCCKKWKVYIRELPSQPEMSLWCCGFNTHKHHQYRSAYAEYFAPIVTQYSDITAELASQVVIGDEADQPVRILTEPN